jgi:squalene cyclase
MFALASIKKMAIGIVSLIAVSAAVCSFAAASGCAANDAQLAAKERAQLADDDWRSAADSAWHRGVDFLIDHQNADGSWGTFETRRPSEIYRGTVASFKAFRDASSALCVMALIEPSRERSDAWRALDRGVEHLLNTEPVGRATHTTFYGTWTHTYVLRAMAMLYQDDRFADRRERIAHTLNETLDRLTTSQGADGGWGYYDFGHGFQTPAGLQSNSFNTASVLIALNEAEAAGFEIDERMIRDGLRNITRLRLPTGVFIYGTGHRFRPGANFNDPKGASARTQPCNFALWLYDHEIDDDDILLGLKHLREHHHFLDIAYGRPRPHEAWYQNSGYYYLYGHFYAALNAVAADCDEGRAFLQWQSNLLADRQNPDGSWFDFPLYGYHKAYGTAFALLALEQAFGEE